MHNVEEIAAEAKGLSDTLAALKSGVAEETIAFAPTGEVVLAAGEKGMRFATPNARIMVHQPSGGFRGQASDIELHAADIRYTKRRLNEIYVHHTGQPYETIEKTLDRDYFMTAEQSRDFGIVDRVLTKREEAEAVLPDGKGS